MKNHTGKLIKEHREKKGLTQWNLAEKLGYSTQQYVSNFERGICGVTPKQGKALRRILDIPRAKLIDSFVADVRVKLEKII